MSSLGSGVCGLGALVLALVTGVALKRVVLPAPERARDREGGGGERGGRRVRQVERENNRQSVEGPRVQDLRQFVHNKHKTCAGRVRASGDPTTSILHPTP